MKIDKVITEIKNKWGGDHLECSDLTPEKFRTERGLIQQYNETVLLVTDNNDPIMRTIYAAFLKDDGVEIVPYEYQL